MFSSLIMLGELLQHRVSLKKSHLHLDNRNKCVYLFLAYYKNTQIMNCYGNNIYPFLLLKNHVYILLLKVSDIQKADSVNLPSTVR